MEDCVFMVLTNPHPGRDDEYNDWYSNKHLDDVLRVPGFKAARRYKLAKTEDWAWQYLAIYEFDSDEPGATLDLLLTYAGTEEMLLSEALDLNQYMATAWVPISERKLA